MKTLTRFVAIALALTSVFTLTFVSSASAQQTDAQIQATITQLEDRATNLDVRADAQEARADILQTRADATNNQRRADRLTARANQLDNNADAIRARIVNIEARIDRLQARLGNTPAPQPTPAPAPGQILTVGDLNLSAAAQGALSSGSPVLGFPEPRINSLVQSVSTNAQGLFSLAEDGRIIDQNGQLQTEASLAENIQFSINRILRFPSDSVRAEFSPLSANAAANLVATLNG